MKFSIMILVFSLGQLASAAGTITATRNGEAKVKQNSPYSTVIDLALKTESVSDDVPKKYIILSNGIVTEPAISGPCKAYQVYQVSFYMGQVSNVMIAVENQPNQNCASEVQKIVGAKTVKVSFTTALLGDGSGDDAAPILLEINQQ